MKHFTRSCILLALAPAAVFATEPEGAEAPDYTQDIAPIFRKYCTGCHNEEEAFVSGELVLESFSALKNGGANGQVVVPGQAEKSKLILVLEKKAEPYMPPEDNEPPTDKEIALLKAWINAGAKGPSVETTDPAVPDTPEIELRAEARRPIHALASSPDGQWIALGRHGTVEILSANDQKVVQKLEGHTGQINAVGFSSDGDRLYVAAGQPGLFGEVTLWSTADWTRQRTLKGHEDALYSAALSPDGRVLATGSYDQDVKLWDVSTGEELRALTAHNGPIFDLAFHPDGTILASASGDATVKLWDVATGQRLETLNEPLEAQHAVAFSPDGRYLAAGGADHRIRIWRIGRDGREGTHPLLYSRFAHDEPILELAFSSRGGWLISTAEDRTIKIWETGEFTQRRTIAEQPDWPGALTAFPGSPRFLVGRLDGSLSEYSLGGEIGSVERPQPLDGEPIPQAPETTSGSERPRMAENEPNGEPDEAMEVPVPATAAGVLDPADGEAYDADLFRFEAKAGESWILETSAARKDWPTDTKIEVLHADGEPVLRYQLQAVRESYITFRSIDSRQTQVRVEGWEEMGLNQFLYMAGEVCKITRMPQGPDSGILFYSNRGKRQGYFDTSATHHAKEDPVYIVEPYRPGTELVDNGLPVFPLYYANDDDAERELGRDSRLTFTAPENGVYLARVTDTRRFGGPEFQYELTIRRPRPDFRARIEGKSPKVPTGSGQRLRVKVDRVDNFSGPIRVEIDGLPAGYHVTSPIVVQAGHLEAEGVINVDPDIPPTRPEKNEKRSEERTPSQADPPRPVEAPKPTDPQDRKPAEAPRPPFDWSLVEVTATATIHGREIVKDLGDLGEVTVQPEPKLTVHLEPDPRAKAVTTADPSGDITVAPGTTTTAMLRIERDGFDGEVKFDVDNLPHGVIVDNIGLNGILIREGESKRRIYLTAADWVPETSRRIHAVTQGHGNQASRPIVLHVRRPEPVAQSGNPERRSE